MNVTAKRNLVTFLTFVRVPLVLLFLVAAVGRVLSGMDWLFAAALAALVMAALSDLLDGRLARLWQVQSKFGAYADPMADKVFYLTVLPTLLFAAMANGHATHGVVLLVFTILFLMRDQWVTFLRSVGSTHDVPPEANWSGKLRTLISFPVACLIYCWEAWEPFRFHQGVLYAMEAAAMAVNLVSICVYTRRHWAALKKTMTLD